MHLHVVDIAIIVAYLMSTVLMAIGFRTALRTACRPTS